MAKGNLFLSQARGKVGSVVFYRQNGQQITRVYTDQVKNPRSAAQNQQRAIFYTVSRWAAAAKYLIDQGQEGITNKTQARQAFTKRALAEVRSALLSGSNMALNAKGVTYLQPAVLSLTAGSLPSMTYGFNDNGKPSFYGDSVAPAIDPTLSQFFAEYPSLGLGKQLTIVWVEGLAEGEGLNPYADIAGINYTTKLHYSEVVFTDDTAALDKKAFIASGDDYIFNPEVLAPSWGGTDTFPTFASDSVAPNIGNPLAFAAIVSDFSTGKWRRSYAPFVISSFVDVDLYDIIATYGKDEGISDSDQYLDQGSGEGTGDASPRTVRLIYMADGESHSISLTNKQHASVTIPSNAEYIDINITSKTVGQYSADSNEVIANPANLNGSASAFNDFWVWHALPAGEELQNTGLTIKTSDGATRTVQINVQSV